MDKVTKREARQQVRAQERARARQALPLEVGELRGLFATLAATLVAEPCDHTLRHALRWLGARGHDLARVVPWLEANGGYCDCEVLANVEEHVDDAVRA